MQQNRVWPIAPISASPPRWQSARGLTCEKPWNVSKLVLNLLPIEWSTREHRISNERLRRANFVGIPGLESKAVMVTGGSEVHTRPHATNSATHQSRMEGMRRDIRKHLLLKNAGVFARPRDCDHRRVETDGRYAQFLHLDLAGLDAVNRRNVPEVSQSSSNSSTPLFTRPQKGNLHSYPGLYSNSLKNQYTARGYDMQFGANALDHLLFIRKLYHLLVSSTTPECPARVTRSSSSLHVCCVSPFNREALRNTPARGQEFITS